MAARAASADPAPSVAASRCALCIAALLLLAPTLTRAEPAGDEALARTVLVSTGIADELPALAAALFVGIERALDELEADGEALDPILGARLLTAASSALERHAAEQPLDATLVARLGREDLVAIQDFRSSELGQRIAAAERRGPGFDRGPPLPGTRERLRSEPGFAARVELLKTATADVEFALAQRLAALKAAALVRHVAEAANGRLDARRLERATRSMTPRIREAILAELPEAGADVYRDFELAELDAYLGHLRSDAFRGLVELCLAHMDAVEDRALADVATEFERR